MQSIHLREKEQFKKLFEQEGIDRLEDRLKFLEVFLQTERHVSASELSEIIKKEGLELTSEFIADTLDLMCLYGFAHQHRFDNGVLRYEHRHIGQHHDHMICTKCNQIIEFNNNQLENLQLQVAAQHGFHMLQHKLEIYGICNRCLGDRRQVLPLALSKPGEELLIKEILGGTGMRLRLTAMGLRIGDHIRVITNNGRGKLVIAADQKRYVLGREMARKIQVQMREQHG